MIPKLSSYMALQLKLGIRNSYTCKFLNFTALKRGIRTTTLCFIKQAPSQSINDEDDKNCKPNSRKKVELNNFVLHQPEHDLKDASVYDTSKTSLESIENLTLFHKPSGNVFNVNPKPVSLFICSNRNVLNFTVNDKDDIEKNDKADKDANIQSVKDLMWQPVQAELKKLPNIYFRLAKRDLTGLVVVTAMAGYAMAPGVLDITILLGAMLGTALCSTSANTINQFLETPFDAQMNRTKNRVLVKKEISSLHGATFAFVTGISGITTLYLLGNPLTGFLGALNIILYTCVYTPMKRMSISNTWLGALVGAIPPMMGWTACTGCIDMGALWFGAILFAWQFPHFNSLSWNLRQDYAKGGYRMMAVLNPDLNKRVCLRYSIGLIGLCLIAPILNITTWAFAIDSLPVNMYLTYLAWNFYKNGDSNTSRKLFRFSLIHLPLVVMLMLISKKTYGSTENNSEKSISVVEVA